MGNYINKQIFVPPPVQYASIPTTNNYNVVSKALLISKTGEIITNTANEDFFVSVCCFTPVLNYNQKPNKVVVWAHGNSTDIYHSYSFGAELANELKENVIFFDYSGYGFSSGEASEQACYDSLSTVMNFVLENYNYKDVTLIGHSIGTGVVIDWVEKNKWVQPIVLISPYCSLFSIITDFTPYFMDKFVSIKKVPNIKCPVKIYHGIYDKLIAVSHSKKLYKALPNQTFKPTYFDATGHDNILDKINWKDINEIMNSDILRVWN